MITVDGDGSQTRTFCYVSDLVDGLVRLTRHRGVQPGPVNLGNPQEITVNDLVSNVLHLTGSSSEIARHPLPVDDPQRRKPDIRKARELLGWEPKVPLMAGLRRPIAWFEQEQNGDRTSTRLNSSH